MSALRGVRRSTFLNPAFHFPPVCPRAGARCNAMEERANLMNMMKLSIKTLIQSALSLGRTLDSDFPPLQQFFVVLEHCLKHGLKGGRPLPSLRRGR